jgi:hypothetical protein
MQQYSIYSPLELFAVTPLAGIGRRSKNSYVVAEGSEGNKGQITGEEKWKGYESPPCGI